MSDFSCALLAATFARKDGDIELARRFALLAGISARTEREMNQFADFVKLLPRKP